MVSPQPDDPAARQAFVDGDGDARRLEPVLARGPNAPEVGQATAVLEERDVHGEILDALDPVAAKEPPAPPVDDLALEIVVVRGHAFAADAGARAAVLAVALEKALRADDPEPLVDDRFELLRQDPARVERKGGPVGEVDLGVDAVV